MGMNADHVPKPFRHRPGDFEDLLREGPAVGIAEAEHIGSASAAAVAAPSWRTPGWPVAVKKNARVKDHPLALPMKKATVSAIMAKFPPP